MENWGLVTYREELLLYDKDNHALNTKRRIAGIIAHEFTHQWFGNLVAPEVPFLIFLKINDNRVI